jgi:hypothetical protein
MSHPTPHRHLVALFVMLALGIAGCSVPAGAEHAPIEEPTPQGTGGSADPLPADPLGANTGGAPDTGTGGTPDTGTGGTPDTGTGGAPVACDKPNRLDVPATVTVSLDPDVYTCSEGCEFTFTPTWRAPVQLDETGLLWSVTDAGSTAIYDGHIWAEWTTTAAHVEYESPADWGVYTIRLDPETWDVVEVSNGGQFFPEPGVGGGPIFSPTKYAAGTPNFGYLLGNAMWDSLFESAGFCLD